MESGLFLFLSPRLAYKTEYCIPVARAIAERLIALSLVYFAKFFVADILLTSFLHFKDFARIVFFISEIMHLLYSSF